MRENGLGWGSRRKHLGGVQVGRVFHDFGVVAVVPVLDDGIKEVSKHLQGTVSKVKGEGLVSAVGSLGVGGVAGRRRVGRR